VQLYVEENKIVFTAILKLITVLELNPWHFENNNWKTPIWKIDN